MIKRYTKFEPCPVCEGHPDLARGQGTRCIGFSGDDEWVHCSRLGEGTRAKFHDQSQTWSHRRNGRCPCGVVHGDAPTDDPPPRRYQSKPKPKPKAPENVRQIGDTAKAKIVATYDYQTKDGALLYQVCRTEPKSFRQRRPDGKGGWCWSMKAKDGLPEQPTTLYRLPELIPAVSAGDTVYIVEGEKDVEALRAAGCVATCNTGGAGKWRDELSPAFADVQHGARIVIIQDRDGPDHKGVSGQEHATRIYESLRLELPSGFDLTIAEAAVGKDPADHLGAGKRVEDFVRVWPIADDLIETNPALFKRHMLARALESPKTVLARVEYDPVEREAEREQPKFHTGIFGAPFYTQLRGAIAISGEPSAGKSYVAISTAVDAAMAGWDVFYLSCEMHQDIIRDRAARAVASAGMSKWNWHDQQARTEAINNAKKVALPDTWHHLDVGIGVSIEMVVEMLADNVTHRPTLVVMDSLSSFVDSMDDGDAHDAFGMANLKHVTRWVTGTRKLAHGHIAYLLLSELNKEGRAKGRALEHRCDTAFAMTTDPEQKGIKKIGINKNWWGPVGSLGSYLLDWELGRLILQEED